MGHYRRNSQVPYTRWRFMRRRRGKQAESSRFPGEALQGRIRKSKRSPRPFRLFLLDLGLARHRHDPQRGDAVALAAQHAEAEAVEGKTLAAFRDRARLMNHQTRNRGRLFIGEMPVHRAVEIA